MKNLIYAAAAMAMALSLAACNKSSGSNNVATTPASICMMNAYGQYVTNTGAACNPTATTTNCSALGYTYTNGVWLNQSGQNVTAQCTVYQGNGAYGANGCSIYTQQYGVYYYPVSLGNGQLACVNSQYLQTNLSGYYNQYYNTSYYGQNLYSCNPYTCPQYYGYYGGQYYLNNNSNCGAMGFGGFYASLCWN